MAKTSKQFLSIQATPDFSGIRTAQLLDIEHTVVPCIALVEGVLWPANAPSPELALAEEFGRFPKGWDGRPIVMNHPQIDDAPVSASNPAILESYCVGNVFNTKLVGNKLHMELWINKARAEELGGDALDTVTRLLEGNSTVEVSTGLFTMSEMVEGEFNGQAYSSVWRNIVPDHLALLSEGTIGACSVEGGCGAPRTLSKQPNITMKAVRMLDDVSNTDIPIVSKSDCDCAGDQHDCDDCKARVNSERKGVFQSLRDGASKAFEKIQFVLRGNTLISDTDIRTTLSRAIADTSTDVTWIIAIFQDSNGVGDVVYEIGWEGDFFRRSYTIAEDGGVTLGTEVVAVIPRTEFIPLEISVNAGNTETSTTQEKDMDMKERVAALIANDATKFTEADEKWLSTLEEAQLESMVPAEVVAPDVDANVDDKDNDAAPSTLASHLEALPEEHRTLVEEGLAIQAAAKTAVIKSLMANTRCEFTESELSIMQLKALQSMAKLANLPDFTGSDIGQGISRINAATEDDFTAAPSTLRAADAT